MRSPKRGSLSLRARVAVAAAVLAVLVGLVAAGVSAFLVEELEMTSQDGRLTDAASLMQREMETATTTDGQDLRGQVDDEALEIAPFGLRLALFENGVRTSGASDVQPSEREGCSSRNDATGLWRTCAVGGAARRVVVSTHRTGQTSRRGMLVASVGGATLLAAIVSALVSRALGGWALAPLTALGDRLKSVTDEAPGKAFLGDPSGTAEVEVLRETIRGLLQRLGEALESSRGFAASAAHELRTPLATIRAELDLASEEAPSVAGSLARVRRTAGRLSVLVERLLLLAGGGANALVTEAVSMSDVVRDVVAAHSEPASARINMTLAPSGMVRGDEALLRIVVENLIDNALKFSEPGKVSVSVVDEGDDVQFRVRDDGPGIDPAEADRLRLPFTRGRGAAVAGHGLGLSIVDHAVNLHDGSFRICASERGADVRVTLRAWTARAA